MRSELFMRYFTPKVRTKSKGAGKGTKVYVDGYVFNESLRRADYLRELAEESRTECGLFLCRAEWQDMHDDRWWDVPGYRDEFVRTYREKIKKLRAEYGLSKSEVSEFMRVD